MEWDNKRGLSEIQRISTAVNLGANELQTISTTVVDVNEVQVITSFATPINEIQEITVSPPPGADELKSSWSYAIQLDTTSNGGSLQYSGQISTLAPSSGSRDSLADIISNMINVDVGVEVTRLPQNQDGGFSYLVTFPLSMKNLPQMEIFSSDVPVSTRTIEDGNLVSGTFRLGFDGQTTESINFDADASEMQEKLQALSTIGTVNVFRGSADDQNGYSWEIEFTSDFNGGDIGNVVIYDDNLTATNPSGLAWLELSEGGTDGSYIKGSFRLEYGTL